MLTLINWHWSSCTLSFVHRLGRKSTESVWILSVKFWILALSFWICGNWWQNIKFSRWTPRDCFFIETDLQDSQRICFECVFRQQSNCKVAEESITSSQADGLEDPKTSELAGMALQSKKLKYHFVDGEHNCVADLLSRWKRKNSVTSKIDHKVQGYCQKKPKQTIQYIQSQGRMCDIGLQSQNFFKPSESERKRLIHEAHEGHWSSQKTYENLLLDLQGKWTNMRREVDQHVLCESQWHGEQLIRDDLNNPQAFDINEVVHLNFCGFFRNEHLSVGVDNFSRFVHAVTMKSPTATAVINFLDSWIYLHGRIQAIFSN